MTITLKVSNATKEKMLEYYDDLKRDIKPQYAVFQANDGDTVVTLYESGKCVFQGRDADLASNFWIETEKINSGKVVVTNSEDKNKLDNLNSKFDYKIYNSTSIGSDEVGTGDYFGPIVVTAAYVKMEDIKFLESLGIKDSKKMSDEKILEVVPKIKDKIKYSTLVLSSLEYNEKYKDGYNMNKIKAILHNKVLSNLKGENLKYDYIVVDEFAKKNIYFNYLKESNNVVTDITFLTKAEDKCLSVACASIISRYIFLKEFKKLENSIGTILPKGASDKVDEVGALIVKKYSFDKLNEIAKLNFKNTEKIKNRIDGK